jgi:meiotic recombination protein SPO11
MENLVVDNLFVAQAARRARALAKAETLACAFIVNAMRAVREGGEMPPPVYGTRRRRRRRDDRDDADEIDADEIDADEIDEETSFGIVVRCVGDGRAYERFWEVLDAVARGLRRSAAAAETTSSTTLRELYYVVNSRGVGNVTESQLALTLRQISDALDEPRAALGICAAAKGQVAGRAHIETAAGARIDCTAAGVGGWTITGDIFELDAMTIHSDAAYVIVVEKDAVFNRLIAERAYETLPCVLVTAKGYPDVATRKFLHLLKRTLDATRPEGAQFFGLMDWNPSGAWILATYSVAREDGGGVRDAAECVVPLTWIGLREEDLCLVPERALLDLTERDEALIRNALDSSDARHPLAPYARELSTMRRLGKKAEIEALYSDRDDFSMVDYVSRKIAARE